MARQLNRSLASINGKIVQQKLSILEKPADKKKPPRPYSQVELTTLQIMHDNGETADAIAFQLGRPYSGVKIKIRER
jgi:hypothetical protein